MTIFVAAMITMWLAIFAAMFWNSRPASQKHKDNWD